MDVIVKDGIPYVTLDYVIKQSGWSKRKNFVNAIKTQSLPFTVVVMKAPKALHIVNKYWVPQNEAEEFIPRYKKENAERLAAAEAESVKINAINYSSSEDKFVLIIEVTYDGETRILRIAPDHI